MHRSEHGRGHCARDRFVKTQPAMQTEGFPFPTAKLAALRVTGAAAPRSAVFLEGGPIPWVASGRDPGRLHSGVDEIDRLGCDVERLARVGRAFAGMSADCVAFSGPNADAAGCGFLASEI